MIIFEVIEGVLDMVKTVGNDVIKSLIMGNVGSEIGESFIGDFEILRGLKMRLYFVNEVWFDRFGDGELFKGFLMGIRLRGVFIIEWLTFRREEIVFHYFFWLVTKIYSLNSSIKY